MTVGLLLQTEPPAWIGQASALLGALGAATLLAKVVDRAFGRADKRDDLAVGVRQDLLRRLEALEKDVAMLRADRDHEYRARVKLEAENQQLRRRWHAFMNWVASEPSLPQPPSWLDQIVEGPTAMRRPDEREREP